MNHSTFFLSVALMMTLAVDNWAIENEAVGKAGDIAFSPATSETATDVKKEESVSVDPEHFEVRQNYLNPFNATIFFEFDLTARPGVFASVSNIIGRRIRIFESNARLPGRYQVEWDGMTDFGQPATSGVYFFLFLTNDN